MTLKHPVRARVVLNKGYAKLMNQEREALTKVMTSMVWDDDPSLGGMGDSCKFCERSHPGKICPKIKSVSFHRDGSIKTIVLKGARQVHDVDGNLVE